MHIQAVTSPGGIGAWLVEDYAVPMFVLRFSFDGGSSQDPVGKDGLGNFVTLMYNQGAGDLSAIGFQRRIEELGVRLNLRLDKDAVFGGLRALTENRGVAAPLLKFVLTRPRDDADAIERIRQRLLAYQAADALSPQYVASTRWDSIAFANHPYAHSIAGDAAMVRNISADDLKLYRRRVFAKDRLKVVAVGDITADELGELLDEIFGDLPARSDAVPVPKTKPVLGGRQSVVEIDVPQSVVAFGVGAVPVDDPDYFPVVVLNHIVGGDTSSRLADEVRAKRGLAFQLYTYLHNLQYASAFRGMVATRNDTVGEALDIVHGELEKVAKGEFSQVDLDNSRQYLIGSLPLRFDSNSKIANELLRFWSYGFGLRCVDEYRMGLAALTLDDLRRAAARIFGTENLITVIAGKPNMR